MEQPQNPPTSNPTPVQPNTFEQTPPPQPPGYESRNVQQVIAPEVKKNPQNLYNSTYVSIIFKNFLAGFFRGLGGILIYVIFLYLGYVVFRNYVYPEIQPLLENIEKLTSLAEQQSQNQNRSIQVTPEMLEMIQQNTTE